MPARITVKAELQSLLNKSQALTDANRLAQLDAEQRRREEVAQRAAQRQKAEQEATRRKQIVDPVGRSRRTAAMGQAKEEFFVGRGFSYFDGEVGGGLVIWSGNGLASVVSPFPEGVSSGIFGSYPAGRDAFVFVFVGLSGAGSPISTAVFANYTTAKQIPLVKENFNPIPGLNPRLIGVNPVLYPPDDRIAGVSDPTSFFLYPAVFPPSIPLPTPEEESSYAYWRSVYAVATSNLKTLAVLDNRAAEAGAGDVAYTHVVDPVGYQWQGPDPGDPFEPVPFTDPLWKPVKVVSPGPAVVPEIPSPLASAGFYVEPSLVWDWGVPAWCRDQLLALGFAPEDLQP